MSMKYLYLLPILLLVFSCHNDGSKYCDNYKYLFELDSIPTIRIENPLEPDSLKALFIDYCDTTSRILKNVSYYWKYDDDSILVNTEVQITNYTSIIRAAFCKTDILINAQGQVLLGMKPIENTTLALKDHFRINEDEVDEPCLKYALEIRVFPNITPLDTTFDFMKKLRTVRKELYEEEAQKRYRKALCNLTLAECDTLRELMPFDIKLDWEIGYGFPPPPLLHE